MHEKRAISQVGGILGKAGKSESLNAGKFGRKFVSAGSYS
jgi:hypothetical protein